MKHTLNENFGFSTVSALVAFGLVSVVMTAMADMSVYSMKHQRAVAIRADFDSFIEEIKTVFLTEASCTAAISDQDYSKNLNLKNPVALDSLLAAVGDSHSLGWTITQIKFEDIVEVEGSEDTLRGTLIVDATKDMQFALGAPVLSRKVSDVYFVSPAGSKKITHCFGNKAWSLNSEQYCKSVGGKWLGDKESGAECVVISQKDSDRDDESKNRDDDDERGDDVGRDKDRDDDDDRDERDDDHDDDDQDDQKSKKGKR